VLQSERFVAVAAGEGHSLYVNDTGDVFSAGRGNEGQLGNGKKVASSAEPQVVEALADVVVVGVAAGSHHSIACTAAGKVFMWGLITVGKDELAVDKKKAADEKAPPSGGDDDDDEVDGEGGSENSNDNDQAGVSQAATGGDARSMLGLTGTASEVRYSKGLGGGENER
jgi:hypothetical protein